MKTKYRVIFWVQRGVGSLFDLIEASVLESADVQAETPYLAVARVQRDWGTVGKIERVEVLLSDIAMSAAKYGSTIAEEIRERDYPMTERECIQLFENEMARKPTKSELKTMAPDSQRCVDEEISYYAA